MRAALCGASMSRMNFAAGAPLLRIFREHHPDPAAGAGRRRTRATLRNRRDAPLARTPPATARPSARGSASCRRGTSRRRRRWPRPTAACSRCWRAPRAATRRSAPSPGGTTARAPAARDAAAARTPAGRRRRRARRPAPRTSAGDRRPSLPSGRRCRDSRRSSRSRAMRLAVAISSSHVRGGVRHEILAVKQRAAIGLVPQAVDVAAAIRQRVRRERQEVRAIGGRPVLVERLQMPAFEKQRQPEAVDRRDVGQPPRRRREQQLGLVLLERRHHRDLELHAGLAAPTR